MVHRIQSAAATDAFTITPSDVTVIAAEVLYIGTTGNVAVVTVGGTTITFSNVPVGILPIRCTKVMSTNTTASNIIGMRF